MLYDRRVAKRCGRTRDASPGSSTWRRGPHIPPYRHVPIALSIPAYRLTYCHCSGICAARVAHSAFSLHLRCPEAKAMPAWASPNRLNDMDNQRVSTPAAACSIFGITVALCIIKLLAGTQRLMSGCLAGNREGYTTPDLLSFSAGLTVVRACLEPFSDRTVNCR